jgi:hypothetical protein
VEAGFAKKCLRERRGPLPCVSLRVAAYRTRDLEVSQSQAQARAALVRSVVVDATPALSAAFGGAARKEHPGQQQDEIRSSRPDQAAALEAG